MGDVRGLARLTELWALQAYDVSKSRPQVGVASMKYISTHTTVRFGQFEFDADAGELRKDGAKVRLQEQPLQILQFLLEYPGNVISREELQTRIWPSDTFVDFDHGINNAIARLRKALSDTAVAPRYVETLPRRGYRFMASTGSAVVGSVESVAVLPLENLSCDPKQEYVADGVTETLITTLAKISALHVVSRTSTMNYKGIRRPLPEIARELKVDWIVEGTVLSCGERIRILAQLINASTDRLLWAETYDRDLRDILALQSEVVCAIATQVQIALTPQAQRGTSETVGPEAYRTFLQGIHTIGKTCESGRRNPRPAGVQRSVFATETQPPIN